MGRMIAVAVVLLGALAWLGTPHAQTGRPSPATQTTQSQIGKLQKEIEDLRKETSALQKSVGDLNARLFKAEINQNANQSAFLDLTSHSYQRIDTSTGSFLVSVRDATPYLDGYRVVLDIGNPSFATYTRFKLKVKWNRSYDWAKYSDVSYQAWNGALHEKEASFTDALKPGTWNKVELLLPTTKGDELGYFLLSMETDMISLYKEKEP